MRLKKKAGLGLGLGFSNPTNGYSSDYCNLKNYHSLDSFRWNIQSLAEYHKINFTGISGNNITKFIYYKISANTLILKLKLNENISAILAIDEWSWSH